jgi:hypothetical protein
MPRCLVTSKRYEEDIIFPSSYLTQSRPFLFCLESPVSYCLVWGYFGATLHHPFSHFFLSLLYLHVSLGFIIFPMSFLYLFS